ncbi:MAG: hypothetical protein IT233_00105 [Bacteroidia bacterium]|nr:hypothetical protein [Bacteroidia bacterium]
MKVLVPLLLLGHFLFSQSDTAYYPNGTIQSITVLKGKQKQISLFYQNGQIQSKEVKEGEQRDGEYLLWYQNGKKQEESNYKDGKLLAQKRWYQNGFLQSENNYKLSSEIKSGYIIHGVYLRNYENGTPQTKGQYKDGEKEGTWEEYYQGGNKKHITVYKDGYRVSAQYWNQNGNKTGDYHYTVILEKDKKKEVLDGKQMTWFDNGVLREESNYKLGKKNGVQKEFFNNGNPAKHSELKDDRAHGLQKRWNQDGLLISETTSYQRFDSLKKYYVTWHEGVFVENFENGNKKTRGNYKTGEKEGRWDYWDEKGQQTGKEYYQSGLKSGLQEYWHKNGKPYYKSNFVLIKKDGKDTSVADGPYKRFSENGNLAEEGIQKLGKKEGIWKHYFPDGRLAEETNFADGLRSGKSVRWRLNGELEYEQSYTVILKGEKYETVLHGPRRSYSQEGKLERLDHYNKGKVYDQSTEYYEDGSTKSQIFYFNYNDNNNNGYSLVCQYYRNGKCESISIQRSGRPAGRHLQYFLNGKLKRLSDYDVNGAAIGLDVTWTADGEFIEGKERTDLKNIIPLKSNNFTEQLYLQYGKAVPPDGTLSEGKLTGNWTWWYSAGVPMATISFKAGHLDGKTILLFPDGKKLFEITLKDGLANGGVTAWHFNGNKHYEGHYENGELSGEWIIYFPNGNKERKTCHTAGVPGQTCNVNWYDNGQMKDEGYYKDGKNHGKFRAWHKNGNLSFESFHDSGLLQGKYVSYYENGQLRYEEIFVDGKKEGEGKYYSENGSLTHTTTYKDGKRHGPCKTYAKEGYLKNEGVYNNEQQDGTWITYNAQGKVEKMVNYSKGVLAPSAPLLPCQCLDTVATKVKFAPPLNNLAPLEEVRQWSFKMHAPIGDFYDHLYYIGMQFSNNKNVSFYSMNIVAYQKIFLRFPDHNGFKLILNPCINAMESRIPFTIHVDRTDPLSVDATLEAKILEIEFDANLLCRWDPEMNKAHTGEDKTPLPSVLQFHADRIVYNERDKFKILKPRGFCIPLSGIGKTGVSLRFTKAVIDLDPSDNPSEMEMLLPDSYYHYYGGPDASPPKANIKGKFLGKDRGEFMGVYAPEGDIQLPKGITSRALDLKAENLMVSSNYVIGTILLPVKAGEGFNYVYKDNKGEIILTTQDLEKKMKNAGFDSVKSAFDMETGMLRIYFYYKKK